MVRLEPYSPTPASRAGRIFTIVAPFVMGLVCVLLSFVPFGRIVGSSLTPAFVLMAIYYWAIVRPEMFPPIAVFTVGLIFDLLSGGIIGLWAFVYVVTYAVVISQRLLLVNAPFTGCGFHFLRNARAAVHAGAAHGFDGGGLPDLRYDFRADTDARPAGKLRQAMERGICR